MSGLHRLISFKWFWLIALRKRRKKWMRVCFYFQTSSLGETRSRVKFVWLNKCHVWLFFFAYTCTKCSRCTHHHSMLQIHHKDIQSGVTYAHMLMWPVPQWLLCHLSDSLSHERRTCLTLNHPALTSILLALLPPSASVCVLFSYTFLIV